jgi:hypothetical protein
MPLWTQAGLVPREESRGDEFTNVSFFGIPDELDPSLRDPAWRDRLHRRGFNFSIPDAAYWSDYSEVDVILAVRSFGYPGQVWRKPASKLFNAWLAGVPAILGAESAYRAERRSDLDYIEVATRDDVEDALERLRDDTEFRERMVANGRERSREIDDAALTIRWRHMLEQEAIPEFERWRRSSSTRRRAWQVRRAIAGRLENEVAPLLGARRLSRGVFAHRGDWG